MSGCRRVARLATAAAVVLLLSQRAVRAVEVPGTRGVLSLTGYLDGQAVVDTGGGPGQHPQAGLDLQLDTRTPNWLSTHVELLGQVGGPYEGGEAGVFNLGDAFQNPSPALQLGEMFADVQWPDVELRLGLQRFAWGKLDGVPPTDVVNPRNYHDPLIRPFEENKVVVPALAAAYYPPDVSAFGLSQLGVRVAYLPITVPSLLPLVGERWFPPTADLTDIVISPEIQAELGLDFGGPLAVPVHLTTTNSPAPLTVEAGGIAARVEGRWRSIDWDVYQYTGADTAPNAELRATVIGDVTNPSSIRALATLKQAHGVLNMTGADAAFVVGDVTIRSEAALLLGRHYLRPASDVVNEFLNDPAALQAVVAELAADGEAAVPLSDLFVANDAIEWGIGADYLINGFVPLLQLNQVIILSSSPRLLISNPDTQLTFVLRRNFWQDRLEADVRSLYTFERGGWSIMPRVSYVLWDNLRVRIGYLAIGGSSQSLIGQFGSNDEFFIQGRYTF